MNRESRGHGGGGEEGRGRASERADVTPRSARSLARLGRRGKQASDLEFLMFYSVMGPFRGFHFFPESVFFFPVSTFQGGEAFLHRSLRALRVMAAFHLLQVFSGWRFQLPLTLFSCLPFFLSFLSNAFSLSLRGNSIPTSLVCTVLIYHFP